MPHPELSRFHCPFLPFTIFSPLPSWHQADVERPQVLINCTKPNSSWSTGRSFSIAWQSINPRFLDWHATGNDRRARVWSILLSVLARWPKNVSACPAGSWIAASGMLGVVPPNSKKILCKAGSALYRASGGTLRFQVHGRNKWRCRYRHFKVERLQASCAKLQMPGKCAPRESNMQFYQQTIGETFNDVPLAWTRMPEIATRMTKDDQLRCV